ncbi:hypothetical protein ERO13_D09G162500v2 [Gossypium hirsutum]|uniref:BAG family molecular chaperone regulator 4 n=5 Tax=Gossypium TaxID=3633 RepID=A0A1U8I5M8_GOSHI|nr:BAG family molecular chaperone regulator 4 [Gossypium hirsutum]KAB2013804.1 hypothetical protein ES319_D09G181900v1 [Gossypium barbadense]TYG54535.1 hypothetical protein ES288_D09G198400v1 [Gossypium darwinii]TYH54783.1 hypothetical protein ES332_D09G194300v1 [Gossypium tomentosum]TYI65877.1 hypothetical protein E1A91_D09G187600v1 [Gossypium mustelinum]KAG4130711.1 hypothetical protein ERO13_D09G162500v2 [Gossypium hirsutum]
MGIGASTPKTSSGELKKNIAKKSGLETDKQRVSIRGKEKDKSKVEETGTAKEKAEETKASKENKVEFVRETEERSKAFVAIAGVRKAVDKLSERVAALEKAVNSGTKVSDEEFDVSAELLMRELLKLDGIEAEGEAKLQRKAEVCRVQNFHETLDKLKTTNSKLS